MIKDILLVIDTSERADPVIQQAAAMAERRCANLTIEILSPNPLLVPASAPFTTMYVPEHALAEDHAARMAAVSVQLSASSAAIRVFGLHDDIGSLARRVGQAGPIADLVLMGCEASWEATWLRRRAAETILLGGGTPLLLLVEDRPLPPVQHAVIGWKDTPEARRAAHDLLMLMEQGGRVSVVSVSEHGAVAARHATDEIVRYIERHGFIAEAHHLAGEALIDCEVLERFALDTKADLLATGAFGHSRLREVVFGGVTASLLDRPWLPTMLSR